MTHPPNDRALQVCEFDVLSLMTADTHKFGVGLTYGFDNPEHQFALERLQLRDWIRLIDVSPVHASPGQILRVFRVMPPAVKWYGARFAEGWRPGKV